LGLGCSGKSLLVRFGWIANVDAVRVLRSWCCDGTAPGIPGVRCRCAGGRRPARRKCAESGEATDVFYGHGGRLQQFAGAVDAGVGEPGHR
jgi:hypothetical protein